MGEGAQPGTQWPQPERRLTVQEAAAELGLSAEAVRSRIKRGTLESTKEGGTVYVLLRDDRTATGHDQTDDRTAGQVLMAEHLDSLRDEIAFLRAELERRGEEAERKDRIIAGLAQANAELSATLRALEAPRGEQESPQSSPEEADEGTAAGEAQGSPQEPISRRPWWRRLWRW